jgi:hypothetical protein
MHPDECLDTVSAALARLSVSTLPVGRGKRPSIPTLCRHFTCKRSPGNRRTACIVINVSTPLPPPTCNRFLCQDALHLFSEHTDANRGAESTLP